MTAAVRATYRLQLGPNLSFADARRLVPYLRELGISHLYLSPSLQARSGSTHGYDVVDPTRVSDDLGGEEELRRLCGAGLGVVLDVVPNHMAACDENPYWRDESLRRRFFDLDEETGRHRRFFDVDDLAGVRVEDDAVFAETHAKILELVRGGLVDGLRIDHVDGLADPAGYLRRLRAAGVARVWVEKILAPGERLRDWPVEGTTGYEFANEATRLAVDPAGERPLTELYRELTGDARAFAEVAAEAKREQVETTFRPEVDRLRRLWDAPGLEEALASFGVYRTYVEPGRGTVVEDDRRAVAAAGIGSPLAEVLLLERDGRDEFVTRFQQTTGPVAAKGVEDTALYRYLRLVCLSEVGGDPGDFSLDVGRLHAASAERLRRFPNGLLASQTHDTKRSGDVRARIAVLSSLADEWATRVRCWFALTQALVTEGAPDAAERYLVFQTLVGAWPIDGQRLARYLEKAIREAKRTTSWLRPDPRWEEAIRSFCVRAVSHPPLVDDLEPFVERVASLGERGSLAEVLLRVASPGAPDVYQGDELWSLNLVDPDNRRPVDWSRRREALAELRAGAAPTRETRKLHVLWKALDLRRRRPGPFAGSYEPLAAGERACAFARGRDVLVVAPVRPGWEGDRLDVPAELRGEWRSVLDGRALRLGADAGLAELVGGAPGLLLERG